MRKSVVFCLVFVLMLAGAVHATKITLTCRDSDGGLNYDVKGTTTDARGSSATDFCSNVVFPGRGVVEYYCDGGNLRYQNHVCEDQCFDGACVSTTAIIEPPEIPGPLVKPLPPFQMAVADDAPASDVVLLFDLGSDIQGEGYEAPAPGVLFSEVSNIENQVTLLVYQGDAAIIVGRTLGAAALSFAAELQNILNRRGVQYQTLISYELISDNLIDIFPGGAGGGGALALTCESLKVSGERYFGICSTEGFDKVCFDKFTGEYQGCGLLTRDDCTTFNVNAQRNIWCDVPAPRCTDSDGGRNYKVKGLTIGVDRNAAIGYRKKDVWDVCAKDSADTLVRDRPDYQNKLFEYSCRDGYFSSETYTCPGRCEDGACVGVRVEGCTDSDGGRDVFVAGFAEGPEGGTYDYCDFTTNLDGNLQEAVCSNGVAIHESLPCPAGTPYCNRGVCSSKAPVCTDTDGGVNVEIRGTITEPRFPDGPQHTDYCQSMDTKQPLDSCDGPDCGIREYYCTTPYYSTTWKDVACPAGCVGGSCRTVSACIDSTIVGFDRPRGTHFHGGRSYEIYGTYAGDNRANVEINGKLWPNQREGYIIGGEYGETFTITDVTPGRVYFCFLGRLCDPDTFVPFDERITYSFLGRAYDMYATYSDGLVKIEVDGEVFILQEGEVLNLLDGLSISLREVQPGSFTYCFTPGVQPPTEFPLLITEDIPPLVYTGAQHASTYCDIVDSGYCKIDAAKYAYPPGGVLGIEVAVETHTEPFSNQEAIAGILGEFGRNRDWEFESRGDNVYLIIEDPIVYAGGTTRDVRNIVVAWYSGSNVVAIVILEWDTNAVDDDVFEALLDAYLAKYPSDLQRAEVPIPPPPVPTPPVVIGPMLQYDIGPLEFLRMNVDDECEFARSLPGRCEFYEGRYQGTSEGYTVIMEIHDIEFSESMFRAAVEDIIVGEGVTPGEESVNGNSVILAYTELGNPLAVIWYSGNIIIAVIVDTDENWDDEGDLLLEVYLDRYPSDLGRGLADLSDYPDVFIEGNTFNAIIVVGDDASSSDVVSAVDIARSIEFYVPGLNVPSIQVASEAYYPMSKYSVNAITIGGPCRNIATGLVLGTDDCMDTILPPGEGLIRMRNNLGQVQIAVAGHSDFDTRKAATVLANWQDYALAGFEVLVVGNSLDDLRIIYTVEEEIPPEIEPIPITRCDGCLLDQTTCLSYGHRIEIDGEPRFCEIGKELVTQLVRGAPCQNDYECITNQCVDATCQSLMEELRETRNMMERLFGWLAQLFG